MGTLGPITDFARSIITRSLRRLKEPHMIYGYRDADGSWRPKTRVSDTAVIYRPENVHLADNVFVGRYTVLDGAGGLWIGEGSQIAAWGGVFTHSSHIAIRLLGHHYQDVKEEDKPAFNMMPTRIGRFVFVGAGAKVMPGVEIGDGALISAGAIVTKDVAPFSIVSGTPGKAVGDVRRLDTHYLTDPLISSWYYEWQTPGTTEPKATEGW